MKKFRGEKSKYPVFTGIKPIRSLNSQDKSEVLHNDYIKCPRCSKDVLSSSNYCYICGYNLFENDDTQTLVFEKEELANSMEKMEIGKKEDNLAPNKKAVGLLYFLLHSEKSDAIIGDLEEKYNTVILPKFGMKYARRWFWFQTIRNLFPFLKLRWIITLGIIERVFSRILEMIK